MSTDEYSQAVERLTTDASSSVDDSPDYNRLHILGRDKLTVWYVQPNTNHHVRTIQQNIVTHLPSVKEFACNAKASIESW